MSPFTSRLLGYLVLVVYVAGVVTIFLTMPSWRSDAVAIGFVVLLAYVIVLSFVGGGVALFRSRKSLEPTEWMRRGGLMEAPSANAHPDEARIRAALATLPDGMPSGVRDEVEAYLAMPDDDEKQLRRDRLIREFYERAGSSNIGFAQRKACNELRLALSPWVDHDPDG
jgi:hypothetical protein